MPERVHLVDAMRGLADLLAAAPSATVRQLRRLHRIAEASPSVCLEAELERLRSGFGRPLVDENDRGPDRQP